MNFSAVQDPASYASYLPGPQGVPQTVADLHHYSSSAAAAVTAAPPTTYPNGSYIAAHHHQVAIQVPPTASLLCFFNTYIANHSAASSHLSACIFSQFSFKSTML